MSNLESDAVRSPSESVGKKAGAAQHLDPLWGYDPFDPKTRYYVMVKA